MRQQLGPRDPRTAARTAAWIYSVSAIVVMVSNALIPAIGGGSVQLVVQLVPLTLLVAALLLILPGFAHKQVLLLFTPVIGVSVVVFLDLTTGDASAGAQVALCLPVLYAASHLRLLGALLAALVAVAGDAIIVGRLKPDASGLLDLVNVSLVLVLMTGLLVQAGRRHDRLVAQLEHQAAHDPLTGLVTRRVLDEAVQLALRHQTRDAGTALILVDIDYFKLINDSYGHPVGDDALVHLAGVLARHARPPDTVVSRLGGDEIAVLLRGCSESVARQRAHDFLAAVRAEPFDLPDGERLTLSISLGVAHLPSGRCELRTLYAAADVSLYEAKRAGRGQVGASAGGHTQYRPAQPAGDPAALALDGL